MFVYKTTLNNMLILTYTCIRLTYEICLRPASNMLILWKKRIKLRMLDHCTQVVCVFTQ